MKKLRRYHPMYTLEIHYQHHIRGEQECTGNYYLLLPYIPIC